MHSSSTLTATEATDAELVHASRSGDREAFARIVKRYQSLVCSLAYSATGSIGRSEDLAQETFVTAWRQLRALREPAHLRAWICGIARNLTHNALRRSQREPVQLAGSVEPPAELTAPEPLPTQQAISREEESILWRALAAIPETYREPMVLFYREHQSVEAVARALGLSEDAVKQRLSRGRVMLQERVLGFVEGTLERTKPGGAFTSQVMSALPLALTAGAVAGGGLGAKGGATTKSALVLAISGTVITAGLVVFFLANGAVALLGACLGYLMSLAAARSVAQRENVRRFWRAIAAGFVVFVLPGGLALLGAGEAITGALATWMGLMHVFVPAAVGWWLWRWSCPARDATAAAPVSRRAFLTWLVAGLAAPAVFSAMYFHALLFHPTMNSVRVPEAQAREMIVTRADAGLALRTHRGEPKWLDIRLPETRRTVFTVRADQGTVALLAEQRRAYATSEYHESPLAWRWVASLLSLFLAPAGVVILVRRRWQQDPPAEAEAARLMRREGTVAKVFAVSVGLALVLAAGGLALATPWHIEKLSAAELQRVVVEPRDASFTVYEYANGAKEIVVKFAGDGARTRRVGAADAALLARLDARGIRYATSTQGPDFTFRDPSPLAAGAGIVALIAGALGLAWWAARVGTRFPSRSDG